MASEALTAQTERFVECDAQPEINKQLAAVISQLRQQETWRQYEVVFKTLLMVLKNTKLCKTRLDCYISHYDFLMVGF